MKHPYVRKGNKVTLSSIPKTFYLPRVKSANKRGKFTDDHLKKLTIRARCQNLMIKNPITCYLSANFMLKRSREFSISVESKKTDTFSKKHDTKKTPVESSNWIE